MLPDRGRGERGEGRKNGTAKYLRGIRGRDPSPTGTCVRRGAEHSTRGACAPRTLNTPSHRMGEGGREVRDAGAWALEQKMHVESQSAGTPPDWTSDSW